jgi:ATP-binding cassette subfamily B protein
MGYMIRLTGYALKQRSLFIGAMLAAGLGVAFNTITPLVLVTIIDSVIPSVQYNLLLPYALLYLLLSGLYGALDMVGRYLASLMAQHVIFDLRSELYDSLMEKDLAFYDENETGQLLARVTTDVTTMREFLVWGYRVIFIGVVSLLGTYYVMWQLNKQLTIYMLLLVPSMILFVYVFAKRVRPLFFSSRTQFGVLSSVLQENIVGMKVIRSYATAERESLRVERENRGFLDIVIKAFKLSALYSPFLTTVLGIATGSLIYYGGLLYVENIMSFGEFVGFVSLVGLLALPARFFSWGVGMYQRASAAAERTFYILDHRDMMMEPENPVHIDRLQGAVEFDRVDFSYRGEKWILKDVSLKVKPGQVVALLGGTGSGKTSLMNLIPRFYDAEAQPNVTFREKTYRIDQKGKTRIDGEEYFVQDDTITIDGQVCPVKQPGAVRVDGVDVRQYGLQDLRKQIGMVHQDPFLFSASLRENIAFARPDATLEEVEEAAKAAMIHDFVSSLEMGYDTVIGERGVTLSGGQKQRVAIARALLADPRILIFDDSTSSVDAKTEDLIRQALENLMAGRTTFIITHRLSAIQNADLVVMMDRGHIVEVGTHEELLARGGLYADIQATLAEMSSLSASSEQAPTASTVGGSTT